MKSRQANRYEDLPVPSYPGFRQEADLIPPKEMPPMNEQLEKLAERVHEAYLTTCDRLGWGVKPENRVPYSDLSEDSKELDRASVRAVLETTDRDITRLKEALQNLRTALRSGCFHTEAIRDIDAALKEGE